MTLFLPMEEYNNKTIINDDPFFFTFSCRADETHLWFTSQFSK
jgi:hypothetical protein